VRKYKDGDEDLTTFIAAENLVGFSTAQPSLFKRNTFEPVNDLKLLIKDYSAIAQNALTMLINLTDDEEVIKQCIDDETFLENLLKRVTVRQPGNQFATQSLTKV
jgi:hypothetical protein